MHTRISFSILLLLLLMAINGYAQKKPTHKYPSLFWEITGNGLKKPSYLFGTMHVSSKMVFHLSDSFYLAIKNVDAVALELNPDLWQAQMMDMGKSKEQYIKYTQSSGNDYLTELSFRIVKYDDELKMALNNEPIVVNSLLYRTYKSKEDFEEDTFLDLYIFQTGKKLGKRGTGVENYYQTEKLITEAYADMAMEKKKQTTDTDNEPGDDITEKMQDAYRRGDLDLLDSLDNMTERSVAFREKFLYARNVIQANSMDTIMKKSSLFVGVGAAHLAGKRGVIELLRKMGYTLRPIMMTDRDAVQKEEIDKLKVPVIFTMQTSDDSLYSVALPGPLFKQEEGYQQLDRRQYSDMNNGAYYLVTRIRTHAAFLGQNETEVLKKVDSTLYENIPGKIISKKLISQNGYAGYDIVNRTRRGDLQRNRIIITPFEILIFKMSGKENYAAGTEADQFFNSIKIKELNNGPLVFEPAQGGFKVQLPQWPAAYYNAFAADGNDRWEYEAVDKFTGTAYLIFKKAVYNFHFLDEDNFDLGLIEESFRNPDIFDKQLQRTPGTYLGYPCLDVKEKMKDGTEIDAKFIIKGPQYYVIAARSKDKKTDLSTFFNSFKITPYQYGAPKNFVDTFLHFSVVSPVLPDLDNDLRTYVEKASNGISNANAYGGYTSYWPKPKYGTFKSDATGEMAAVTIQEFPKYYFIKDADKYWKDYVEDYKYKNDLFLYKTEPLTLNDQVKGTRFILRDTNTSRTIVRTVLLKDNFSFSLVSMGDTLTAPGTFIENFFSSFKPEEKILGKNIYTNRLDAFFDDLFSKDSTTRTKARQYISNLNYGEEGIPKIVNAINRLKLSDKDYFDSKTKLIAELGYIKDTINHQLTGILKGIYEQCADTSTFQNEVFRALARHTTKESYGLLKELLIQDPPIFENSYDYSGLFTNLYDSLQLTHELFPELLQLLAVDDYKENVLSLLVTLVDSNIVKAEAYEAYFSKIYFDAKVELKKQMSKDEKIQENVEGENDDNDKIVTTDSYGSGNSTLDEYCVLLMPFYDRNINVQKYFEKLLQTKDIQIKLKVVVLLLRNKKNVADSIIQKLASTDRYRSRLYTALEEIKRLDRFPAQYKNQLAIARSILLSDKDYNKVDSVVFLKKQPVAYKNSKGMVYFFKYRVKKADEWKIGFSGLQPEKENEISSNDDLAVMTEKKIKKDEPVDDQFQKLLKKILFNFHKSSKNFYNYNDYYGRMRPVDDYED